MPTALITGITGQDGSYLAELLLEKGYVVHGIVRRSSITARGRLDQLFHRKDIYEKRFFLHYADLGDMTTIRRILLKAAPDELYHLAGQSHVGASFEIPETTCEFTAMGTLRILEILRDLPQRPKVLHISSSEIFGRPIDAPQNEQTPYKPVTPYGVAKCFATQMIALYRASFDFFACNAICYNHESPRRGETFVTRKITRGLSRISTGLQDCLYLGNLNALRDWGHAKDYVEAMWLMLQQDEAEDFVIATGEQHSVREFCEKAAPFFGLNFEWMGEGLDEVGFHWGAKKPIIKVDPKYFRPAEVETLLGDPTKAKEKLGWEPKTSFDELIEDMCIYGQ